MDFVLGLASFMATLGRELGLFGLWTRSAFEGSAWITGWMQALCALLTLPFTWFVAAWSSQKAAHEALKRDWLTRAEASVSERQAQEDLAARQLFERHCNLATQILYCAIRVKWAGDRMRKTEGVDDIASAIEGMHQLIEVMRYYCESIKHLNMNNSRVHNEKQAITAPIDEVLILLISVQRSLGSLVQEAFGEGVEDEAKLDIIQNVGEWIVECMGDINDSLRKLLSLMGPEVQVWVERQRPNLERVFGEEGLPNLPQVLLTAISHGGAPHALSR